MIDAAALTLGYPHRGTLYQHIYVETVPIQMKSLLTSCLMIVFGQGRRQLGLCLGKNMHINGGLAFSCVDCSM